MFIAVLFHAHEPMRLYGPFDTEDQAFAWVDEQTFEAATIHELRAPTPVNNIN